MPSDLKKITIALFGHVFVYLPIYTAKQKGFFKEQGLDVTYISTGGDDKTWAAVTSGSAQFGIADPTFVAIAREKGDKSGRIIASIIDGVPFWGVSKNDRYLKSNSDLNGLRVATYPAPSTNYALMERMIKGENLKTKIMQGSVGTLLPMLKNNRADVAMILEPTVSIAVEQGFHVVFSYKDHYENFAFTGLSTTKEYIEKHPQICQKVVNALQKAYNFAYDNFEGSIEVAKKQFPSKKRSVLQKGLTRMIKDNTIPENAILKESSWQKAVKLRLYIGDLEKDAHFTENVNNKFAKKALNTTKNIE